MEKVQKAFLKNILSEEKAFVKIARVCDMFTFTYC